jgi:hypothetical protein
MGHAKTFLAFVNFSSVTDAESENDEFRILNLADDTPVAYTVLAELAKFGTAQRLAYAARINKCGYALV